MMNAENPRPASRARAILLESRRRKRESDLTLLFTATALWSSRLRLQKARNAIREGGLG